MNYKALIDELSRFSEYIPPHMRDDDGKSDIALRAADAIETLLKERDALLEDLDGICDACKHRDDDLVHGCVCFECRKINHWEWRGVKEDK